MKKERFLGYLDALMDMAEAYQFNEDQIPELIGDIRKKAEELELVEHTIPYTPIQPWWEKPYITWSSDSLDSISYICKIPEPNEWSVEKNSKLPSNWKIIK